MIDAKKEALHLVSYINRNNPKFTGDAVFVVLHALADSSTEMTVHRIEVSKRLVQLGQEEVERKLVEYFIESDLPTDLILFNFC